MWIASVLVSATAVAVLVRRLQGAGQRVLADEIGFALDADRHEIRLGPGDERAILSVLRECPVPLRPLRDALQANARRRK